MKNLLIISQFLLPILSCTMPEENISYTPVDFVDPFIGVADGRTSNCVIGPQLPFASINPSPQTPNGWHDGYSPDEPIRGFGQLHASGTGWGKYGMFLVSPQTGLYTGEQDHDSPKSAEKASAFEYAVTLNRYDIDVKLTPSRHSAIYQFTYPQSDSSTLLFDVTHNIPMHIATVIGGEVSDAHVEVEKDGSVSGYGEYSGGFGSGSYKVYFSAQTSKNPSGYGVWLNDQVQEGQQHDQ